MTKKKETTPTRVTPSDTVSLSQLLSKQKQFSRFQVWLIGDTPLIVHAWSEKAKREMLAKQVKAVKQGREVRDPYAEFEASLYKISEGVYGFPVTAFKNAITSGAHKDKGLARTALRAGLWLDATMVRMEAAMAGAICDMPLTRIWGSEPEMREDMVRVGSGLQKTSSTAYRAQFSRWAVKITGRFDSVVITPEALAERLTDAGLSYGVGDWRTEKTGVFGSFHMGSPEEEEAWEAFAAGEGPLPGG